MSVIRLDLAYDGTDFHGWARQPGVRTVEGLLAETLGKILGRPPQLSVAGRTDAGVHAEGQVASFPAPLEADSIRIQRAVNAILGPEVVVVAARWARDGFDARHSASGRMYRYRLDTSVVPSPFDARFVWYRPGGLSAARMRAAARHLTGEHDFASFCRAPKLQVGTVRTLRRLAVHVRGSRVEITAEADGFLHQMVRSLVGTLVVAGEGRLDPDSMPRVLASRHRGAAGPVAPPHGLSLVRVFYARPVSEQAEGAGGGGHVLRSSSAAPGGRCFDARPTPQVD